MPLVGVRVPGPLVVAGQAWVQDLFC